MTEFTFKYFHVWPRESTPKKDRKDRPFNQPGTRDARSTRPIRGAGILDQRRPAMSSPDKVEGFLEVGVNERHEVVINLDRDRTGHIIFSPNQARNLARVLLAQANEADAHRPAGGVSIAPE